MAMSVCCYQKRFDASIEKARAKLAFTIGEDNILAGRKGFMPPAISQVRSAPAFIFGLNDEGESSFRHGIIGTDDFWEYPESHPIEEGLDADADADANANADDGALGGAQAGAGACGSGGGFPSGPTTRGGDQPPSAGGNTVPPKP